MEATDIRKLDMDMAEELGAGYKRTDRYRELMAGAKPTEAEKRLLERADELVKASTARA